MKDKSSILVILVAVLAIVVVVLSSIFGKKEEEPEIRIVTNYSDFYTVNSCLYRMVTYASSNDLNSLLLVLDKNYINENKIDITNVLSVFPSIDEDSTFVSKKMYYQILGNNITKYYVYGIIEDNSLYEDGSIINDNKEKSYFIVFMDKKNKTFSVEPYDGKIFNGGEANG